MVEENWLKVAGRAMVLGIGLYLIPLGMIANPDLIRLETASWPALFAALKIGVGLAAISFGIIAPKALWLRAVLVAAGAAALFFAY